MNDPNEKALKPKEQRIRTAATQRRPKPPPEPERVWTEQELADIEARAEARADAILMADKRNRWH